MDFDTNKIGRAKLFLVFLLKNLLLIGLINLFLTVYGDNIIRRTVTGFSAGRCPERRRPWKTCCGVCIRTPAVAVASDCANRSCRHRPSAGPRWTPTGSTAIRSPAVSTGSTRWSAGPKWTRPVSRATRSPVSGGSRPWKGTGTTATIRTRRARPDPRPRPTPIGCSARDRNSGQQQQLRHPSPTAGILIVRCSHNRRRRCRRF